MEKTHPSCSYTQPLQSKPRRVRSEADIKAEISKCDAQILEISAKKYILNTELLKVKGATETLVDIYF